MSELYKCVITPNVRTIKLQSLPVDLRPGPHWILEDGKPPRVIIPPGCEYIESFTIAADGSRVVNETLIAGVGCIRGALPAPKPDGSIDLVITPDLLLKADDPE